MAVYVEVENLSFTYGQQPVISDVSFNVAAGEILGIIGPNGSGKSTLIKLISKVLVPQAGRIRINGEDIRSWSRRRLARTVAVVPQETQIQFAFTVEEIVEMGRAPYLGRLQVGRDRDREIVNEAMRATDILQLADRYVTELSGGERQRVIVARALAQEPQVLLLDEATSALDINHEVEMFELVRALTERERLATVAVLHDLNLAAQYCDRLLLLSQGRVKAIGRPEVVLTAENIATVYGTEAVIHTNPLTGKPQVLVLPKRRQISPRHRVHVVGGGGSAAHLLRLLAREGYFVSTGVVNRGDTDCEVARALGLEVVEETPFSPVSPGNYRALLRCMCECDAVILAETPIGNGNLANLEALSQWQKRKSKSVPLIMLGRQAFSQRDYTGGKGRALLEQLATEALCFDSEEAVIKALAEYLGDSCHRQVQGGR